MVRSSGRQRHGNLGVVVEDIKKTLWFQVEEDCTLSKITLKLYRGLEAKL